MKEVCDVGKRRWAVPGAMKAVSAVNGDVHSRELGALKHVVWQHAERRLRDRPVNILLLRAIHTTTDRCDSSPSARCCGSPSARCDGGQLDTRAGHRTDAMAGHRRAGRKGAATVLSKRVRPAGYGTSCDGTL